MGQDEVEVGAQRHTQQAVNRRCQADTRQIQAVGLPHPLAQLVPNPGELRQQLGAAARRGRSDANQLGRTHAPLGGRLHGSRDHPREPAVAEGPIRRLTRLASFGDGAIERRQCLRDAHVQVLQTIEDRPAAFGGMPIQLIVAETGRYRPPVRLDGLDLTEHRLGVSIHDVPSLPGRAHRGQFRDIPEAL